MRTAASAVVLLATPAVVSADALRADGDGVVPVTNNALNLGSVCSGDTVTDTVLLAVAATGHPGGMNVYANGATVTVTVSATAGSGLSAANPAGPIVLPLTWTLLPNGTISEAVSSEVTLVAGAVGSFAGSVTYAAVGPRSTGGTLTRTGTLAVNATVVDCDPPVLTLPADMTVEATGAGGATVTYTATASDAVDGPITPSCAPASGSLFALGTTVVSCTATDAAGNTASGSFSVTVVDTTAPALTLPADMTVEATGAGGATVTYTATAGDAVDGPITPSCAPASGSLFALGTTVVSCTATDAAGNTASGSFSVTVVDTTAPALTLPADMTVEATGAGGATVTYTATAGDAVDGPITPSCAPASGSLFALGTTVVSCTATDAPGNTASGSFSVTVTAAAQPPSPSATPSPSSPAVGGSLPDTAALPAVASDAWPITPFLVALAAVSAGIWLARRAQSVR